MKWSGEWRRPRRIQRELVLGVAAIEAARTLEELVVAALLDDAAVVEHDHPVRMFDRREPVGNDQRGATLEQSLERFLDQRFGFGIPRWVCRS